MANNSNSKDPIPETRIFVGGISWKADEENLANFFASYGPVVECKIIMDKVTGKSKGYGFVTFQDVESANRVKSSTNLYFMGKMMNVGDAVRKSENTSNTSNNNGTHINHRDHNINSGMLNISEGVGGKQQQQQQQQQQQAYLNTQMGPGYGYHPYFDQQTMLYQQQLLYMQPNNIPGVSFNYPPTAYGYNYPEQNYIQPGWQPVPGPGMLYSPAPNSPPNASGFHGQTLPSGGAFSQIPGSGSLQPVAGNLMNMNFPPLATSPPTANKQIKPPNGSSAGLQHMVPNGHPHHIT